MLLLYAMLSSLYMVRFGASFSNIKNKINIDLFPVQSALRVYHFNINIIPESISHKNNNSINDVSQVKK